MAGGAACGGGGAAGFAGSCGSGASSPRAPVRDIRGRCCLRLSPMLKTAARRDWVGIGGGGWVHVACLVRSDIVYSLLSSTVQCCPNVNFTSFDNATCHLGKQMFSCPPLFLRRERKTVASTWEEGETAPLFTPPIQCIFMTLGRCL